MFWNLAILDLIEKGEKNKMWKFKKSTVKNLPKLPEKELVKKEQLSKNKKYKSSFNKIKR